ncbi:MAG: hypothetical protein ACRDJH_05155 [Thermomicrobiales bacterium]
MTRSSDAPTARVLAIVLILIGAVTMVVAVFADDLGVSGGGGGFGWKQLIGAIAGLVILLGGVAWLVRPLTAAEPDSDEPFDLGNRQQVTGEGRS